MTELSAQEESDAMQAEIDADFAAYHMALTSFSGHSTCVRIEQKYGLYGYPPEIVSYGLFAAKEGRDPHAAIDELTSGES